MAGSVYQIVTGSFSTLPQAMATASLAGWLVFGSIELSGSTYSVLMGRGTGVPIPIMDTTRSLDSSLSSGSSATASFGMWQSVYPPQSSQNTLLEINTNPNVISVRS